MKNTKKVLLLSLVAIVIIVISDSSFCQEKDFKNIIGKEWKVVEIKGNKLNETELENGYPKIIFGENNKLTGFTGCNTFSGTFKVEDSNISLDPGVMTKMMCGDDIEMRLLSAIKNITKWKFADKKLELTNTAKTVLTLVLVNE